MSDPAVPSPERIKLDVEHLKDWLSKEPHLAHLSSAEDEEWLETFLYNNKFSLEKTKYKLANLYSIRSKYPEIFKNRDPTGADLLELKNHFKHVPGHKPTKDGAQVVLIKLEGDSRDFDVTAYLKINFMTFDMLLLDKNNRLANFVYIADLKNLKPGHIFKLMPVLPVTAEVVDKVYTARTTIHIINLPNFGRKFIEAIMKFLPKRVSERMHVHGTADSTLLEAVDEEVVCSDFGGKGPSIAELQELHQKKFEQLKGWFENQGNLCSNEDLRRKDCNETEEIRGSFRKLEVD